MLSVHDLWAFPIQYALFSASPVGSSGKLHVCVMGEILPSNFGHLLLDKQIIWTRSQLIQSANILLGWGGRVRRWSELTYFCLSDLAQQVQSWLPRHVPTFLLLCSTALPVTPLSQRKFKRPQDLLFSFAFLDSFMSWKWTLSHSYPVPPL